MAKAVEPLLCGVDARKAEWVAARSDTTRLDTFRNSPRVISQWLKTLPSGSRIALEATGIYHRQLARLAHEAGHQVFLVDGYQLNHYREGVGPRAKTDPADAKLILRYLSKEQEDLKPWIPPDDAFYRIQGLMRRRASLVQSRVALSQSLQDIPELKQAAKQLESHVRRIEQLIVQRIKHALAEVGWWGDAQRCQGIEGIGDLTAMALANTFHRGAFTGGDAFIAYLGMDVRVRDSGKHKGRRKLTKKGDPELRRLLYNAAMAARKTHAWKGLYETYVAQGLKPTQALIKLARKLARIAFALMRNQAIYQKKLPQGGCYET